jgi:hypothetical protein
MSLASKYTDAFLQGMEKSGIALYNLTIRDIKQMDTDSYGNLVRSQNNVDQIDSISSKYSEFFSSNAYNKKISDLLKAVAPIAAAVSQKFTKQYGEIPVDYLEQAATIAEQYYNALEITLTSDMVEQGITNPVLNDLYHALGKPDHLDDLKEDYKGTKDIFYSYFVTKVTVLLEQFERELTELYGGLFDVQKWEYAGPADEKNRDFCAERVGGIFTNAEIESWAKEDWEGKIPGTSMETIFTNAGGFNCRHTFFPASDDAQTQSEKNPPPVPLVDDPVAVKYVYPKMSGKSSFDNHTDLVQAMGYENPKTNAVEYGKEIGLNEDEVGTIATYSQNGFDNLNRKLQGREYYTGEDSMFSESQLTALDEELYKTLDKMQPTQAKELYRQEKLTYDDKLRHIVLGASENGKVIEAPGYWSTAHGKDSSFFGESNFDRAKNYGRLRIIIEPKSQGGRAKTIQRMSQFDEEKEVLFMKGTKFQQISYDAVEKILRLKEI